MISVPPVGCLPAQRTLAGGIERRCVQKYNEAAELFNTKLSAMADSQNNNLSDARVVFMDAYNPFLHILQHIHKYGKYIYIHVLIQLIYMYYLIRR